MRAIYRKSGPNNAFAVPTIRKVIRQGEYYYCCICRRGASSWEEARHCLESCWREVLHLSPIVLKYVRKIGQVHQCRFCSRDYRSQAEGIECANACRHEFMQIHKIEQQTSGLCDIKARNRQFDTSPVGLKSQFIPRFNLQHRQLKVNHHLPQDCPIAPAANGAPKEESMPVVPLSSDSSPPRVSLRSLSETIVVGEGDKTRGNSKKARRKSEFKKRWVRNNAKYECMFCHELHFTKLEVDSCFDSHFNDADEEIK